MEINEENYKSFGSMRKVMKSWINTLQFQHKKQNKQNNLLTLTVSCEECFLVRRKKNRIK